MDIAEKFLSQIIKDNREFRNSISWETDKYLKLKEIKWENIIS